MRLYLYLLLVILVSPFIANAQASGDIRSRASGSWTTPANWETYDVSTGTWITNQSTYPTSAANIITIGDGHVITIGNGQNITTDQTFIGQGGKLQILAGGVLTLNNGENADLNIAPRGTRGVKNGELDVFGKIVALNGSRIANSTSQYIRFESGSTFDHAHTTEGGSIPTATWKNGSILLISSYTTNSETPQGFNQSFGTVIWNTPSLSSFIDLSLAGTVATKGNIEFINTGSEYLILSSGNDYVLNVGGNMILRENASVTFAINQSSAFVNITGNLDIQSSTLTEFTEDAALSINVTGNFILAGSGNIDLVTAYESGAFGDLFLRVTGITQFSGGNIINSSADPSLTNLNLSNVSVGTTGNSTIANATVNVLGNWNSTGGTFNGVSSIFNFAGANQTIQSSNQPFGHTVFSNSGIKTTIDAMNVDGNISFAGNSTFDLNGQQLSVAGNWQKQSGNFLPNNGLVILDGEAQTVFSNGQPFANLQVAGTDSKLLLDQLDVRGNLQINANATLDVNSTINIFLGGNWTNNGSFLPGSATVFFNGAATQAVGGSAPTNFEDMVVSNSGSPAVRIISDQNILGTLSLLAGAQFDPDGSDGSANFTLISGPDKTATIGALVDGAIVQGSVVVQRYVQAEGIIFRYISTPVTSATVADLTDDTPIITGNLNTANLFLYDETVTGYVDEGWMPYPTALTAPLAVGRGYSIEVVNGTQAVTLDVKGPVNQGDFSFPVTYTHTEAGEGDEYDLYDDGWNLLGNPYPSAIDWIEISKRKVNIEPTIWIANNAPGTLEYASYNAEALTGLNGGSPFIASGQGFWVKASASGAALNVVETDKSGNTDTEFFRKAQPEDVLVIALSNGKKQDEAAVIFRSNANPGFEVNRDSYKKKNDGFSISTLGASGEDLAYNFMPWFGCTSKVPLFLDNTAKGAYTISFKMLETFTRPVDLTLVDTFTGKRTVVASNATYSFNVTTDPASTGWERFYLETSQTPVISEVNGQLTVNGVGNYQWYLNGEQIKGATEARLIPQESGRYTVSIQTATCSAVSAPYTMEVLGLEELQKLGIALWPNPTNDIINLSYTNTNASSISVKIYSAEGKIVIVKQFSHAKGDQHKIDLRTLRSGLYVLEIQDNKHTTRTRIIKR